MLTPFQYAFDPLHKWRLLFSGEKFSFQKKKAFKVDRNSLKLGLLQHNLAADEEFY